MFSKTSLIGIIGSGAMGSGIAQVAATASHKVIVYDNNEQALRKADANLRAGLSKLVEKQKITNAQQESIIANIRFVSSLESFAACDLVIEAIVENLDVKRSLFTELDKITTSGCVLASNTSSLSITSIASACRYQGRVLGIHFFNPATLMPLVEIIPGIATDPATIAARNDLVSSW